MIDPAAKLRVEQSTHVTVVARRHLFQIDAIVQPETEHERFADGLPAFQSLTGLGRARTGQDSLPVDAGAGRVAPPLAGHERSGTDAKSEIRLVPPVHQVVAALVPRQREVADLVLAIP